jgi:hypothetical protein
MGTTQLPARKPGIWGLGAWPWILLLLAVSVLGFWTPYFSRLTAAQGLAHVHVLMMLAWMGMLVAQPMLVRARQLEWHRRVGKASYAVVPLMIVSALALAQLRMRAAPPQMVHVQQFILYLGVAASLLFLVIWGLGIRYRRDTALHARFMVATALTLVDPSLARVMIFWVPAVPPPLYQWISFGMVYAVLLLLIVRDPLPRGRKAFVGVLALFVAMHVSVMWVPGTLAWQRFASWYAGFG